VTIFVNKLFDLVAIPAAILVLSFMTLAQSSDQNFPTPISSNELNGVVKARDIGDSRATSYYFVFDGGQGDIFINVVTKNLAGDIDIYSAENQRPLTKMVIFADSSFSETGRLIYLRKPERLILRIQARTPNDDPAVFRIKFGGAFTALADQPSTEQPVIDPAAERTGSNGIRVNSVGTIVELPSKPKPPVRTVAEAKNEAEPKKTAPSNKRDMEKRTAEAKTPLEPSESEGKPVPELGKRESGSAERKRGDNSTQSAPVKRPSGEKRAERQRKESPVLVVSPDPMAQIHLVIQMKDGKRIERPMSDVLKFSIDKGIYTIITKDGKVIKLSIFDVSKVSIE